MSEIRRNIQNSFDMPQPRLDVVEDKTNHISNQTDLTVNFRNESVKGILSLRTMRRRFGVKIREGRYWGFLKSQDVL